MRRKRGGRKPKGNRAEALTKAVDVLFKVPAWMGYGQHWPLDDDQAAQLGGALSAVAGTMTDATTKRLEKMLDKYVPWGSLAFIGLSLTVPRVIQTRDEMRAARQQEQARAGRPNLEIVRATRADKAAPLTDDASATIAVAVGRVEETRAVNVFGGEGTAGGPGGANANQPGGEANPLGI